MELQAVLGVLGGALGNTGERWDCVRRFQTALGSSGQKWRNTGTELGVCRLCGWGGGGGLKAVLGGRGGNRGVLRGCRWHGGAVGSFGWQWEHIQGL